MPRGRYFPWSGGNQGEDRRTRRSEDHVFMPPRNFQKTEVARVLAGSSSVRLCICLRVEMFRNIAPTGEDCTSLPCYRKNAS